MRSSARAVEIWNRKIHYYAGLYFLFFLWLFALTGLMLNHQQWFNDLYQRRETAYGRSIGTPSGPSRLEQAQDVMRQLEIRGELEWATSQPVGHLDFSIARPNGSTRVRVDLNAQRAYIREFDNGALHAFQIFHTFSGTRFNQPANQRDWILTTAWVLAMDALATGLIAMVLGGYYMWWRLKNKKTLGVVALAGGFAACLVFVGGLL